MTDRDIVRASERLLRPYRIPRECPYLSENQRELSVLNLRGRSAWMAEWLLLASARRPAGLRVTPARSAAGAPNPRPLPSTQKRPRIPESRKT
jgi:hypothetical protein